MDIQERFGLFDSYVESIDGLSDDIKVPISQMARYAFEADTGIDVTSSMDTAKSTENDKL